MAYDGFGDRRHTIVDMVVVMAAVGLALALWACLGNGVDIPHWKAWVSVCMSLLLALAALTRHPEWEVRLKLGAVLWLLVAPWMLGLGHLPSVVLAHLAFGAVVASAVAARLLRGRAMTGWEAPRLAASTAAVSSQAR